MQTLSSAGRHLARAGMVTLRRLEAEVDSALNRRDELRARGTETGSTTDSAATDAIAPPPLDLDLTGHALAAVTTEGLQRRARAEGSDPAAGGAHTEAAKKPRRTLAVTSPGKMTASWTKVAGS
jgi:hypothetical protein